MNVTVTYVVNGFPANKNLKKMYGRLYYISIVHGDHTPTSCSFSIGLSMFITLKRTAAENYSAFVSMQAILIFSGRSRQLNYKIV